MRMLKGTESVQETPPKRKENVQETPPKKTKSMQNAFFYNTKSHQSLYLEEILTQKPKENWEGFNNQIKA